MNLLRGEGKVSDTYHTPSDQIYLLPYGCTQFQKVIVGICRLNLFTSGSLGGGVQKWHFRSSE